MVERYAVYGALRPIELGVICVVLAPNMNIELLRNTLTYLFFGVEKARKKLKGFNNQGEHVCAVS